MSNLRSPTAPRNRTPTPALDAWRRELAAGKRTAEDFDPLWRAACAEMNALEAATPTLAARYLAESLAVVRQAARKARSA